LGLVRADGLGTGLRWRAHARAAPHAYRPTPPLLPRTCRLRAAVRTFRDGVDGGRQTTAVALRCTYRACRCWRRALRAAFLPSSRLRFRLSLLPTSTPSAARDVAQAAPVAPPSVPAHGCYLPPACQLYHPLLFSPNLGQLWRLLLFAAICVISRVLLHSIPLCACTTTTLVPRMRQTPWRASPRFCAASCTCGLRRGNLFSRFA